MGPECCGEFLYTSATFLPETIANPEYAPESF